MKKTVSILISAVLLFSLCSCSSKEESVTEVDANEFLTSFFSDYAAVNTYLKDRSIAVSAFSLDGAGLSSLLRALYQAQSVTYAFSEPVKSGENVFTSSVTVVSLDMINLFTMYNIDREIAVVSGEELNSDFVAESFYANIIEGTTSPVTTTVTVTISFSPGEGWTLLPNNDLAFAIFPNIQNA